MADFYGKREANDAGRAMTSMIAGETPPFSHWNLIPSHQREEEEAVHVVVGAARLVHMPGSSLHRRTVDSPPPAHSEGEQAHAHMYTYIHTQAISTASNINTCTCQWNHQY